MDETKKGTLTKSCGISTDVSVTTIEMLLFGAKRGKNINVFWQKEWWHYPKLQDYIMSKTTFMDADVPATKAAKIT